MTDSNRQNERKTEGEEERDKNIPNHFAHLNGKERDRKRDIHGI